MTDQERINLAIERLNQAFKADPEAMSFLLLYGVPCNEKLADDPYVPVRVIDEHLRDEFAPYYLSPIGLVNGVLKALDLPPIAVKLDNREGKGEVLGFIAYNADPKSEWQQALDKEEL